MKVSSIQMHRPLAVLLAALIGIAVAGSSPHFDLNAAEEGGETIVLAGFTFKYAEPWKEKQVTSPMRAAELTYEHEDEKLEDLNLVFYHFPNQGGGTRANLDRWIGQFAGDPKVEEESLEFDGTKVSLLTASGTFNEPSGGPFSGNSTPRENYTMLAAVVESESGPVFLKLYGPNASVDAVKEAFKKLTTSPFAAE